MTKPTRSAFDNNPLRKRLAALRRRLRFVVTVRGIGWLLTLVLLSAVAVGALDWLIHLPALVRAIALVALLSAGGILAVVHLLQPLLKRVDDLSLALRIEERYPSLNDALASTIQFLEVAEKKSTQGESGPPSKESSALRREAARRAMKKAEGCDFNRIIDTRGLRAAGLAGGFAGLITVGLCFLYPAVARTAIARLTNPFGPVSWPTDTTIELDPHRTRIGRNEAFEVSGSVKGIIPDKATVVYLLDNGNSTKHECRVTKEDGDSDGHIKTQFRPNPTTNHFRFQVRANDAESEWVHVEVAPAPTLTVYKGKASPQITLFYPDYTEMTPRVLDPGTGAIDTIAGTTVALSAAANVPLRAAWLEYHPEPSTEEKAANLSPFGSASFYSLLTTSAAMMEITAPHPATLSEDRKSFHLRFYPRVNGTYSIHFEDDTGLRNQRSYELRVRPDPSPLVTLERPSVNREILDVLPGALLPLRVVVADPTFGIRSTWLDYRTELDAPFRRLPLFDPPAFSRSPSMAGLTGTALTSAVARLKPGEYIVDRPLFLSLLRHTDGSPLKEGDLVTIRAAADDHDKVTVNKQPGLSAEVEIRIVTKSALELALNREQAKIQQELQEIRQLQRDAARKVNEIENRVAQTKKLTLDDQAELTRLEQAQQQIRERLEAPGQDSLKGRVERVMETLEQNGVERSAVEERLDVLRRELDRLGRDQLQQIEAALTGTRKQAENAEDQRGEASAKALEREAERAEKQARQLEQLAEDAKRPETEREKLREEAKTLTKQASRMREMARETRQDAAARTPEAEAKTQERAKELERLAQEREELGRELLKQAEREQQGQEREMLKLAEEQKESARSLKEQGQAQADLPKREKPDLKAGLTEARRRQEEVEKTLSELLKHMEPWSTTREVKGEARAILEGQRRLTDDVEAMKRQGMLGKEPGELTPQEKAQLENAVANQQKLRERMQEMTDKMRRLAEERKTADPSTARELREALQQIEKGNVGAHMKSAREQLEQNQLENAGREQEKALTELKDLVKKMEDRRDAELDRNIKQMKEAEKLLEELADEQDRLRKKLKEAEKIADPRKREEELKRLAREQQELQKKTEEAARQLSRLRAERAVETLNQAAKQMGEAVKRLERGEPPGDQQEEALDRLEEAKEDVERNRNNTEEELAREQLARVADVLKRLKERHERLLEETERIKKEVLEQKEWTRGLLISLGSLAEAEKGLADEARALAERELSGADVFARQLRRAADAMKEATDALTEHKERAIAMPKESMGPEQGERLQRQAQRYLQSLLDALKMDQGESARRGGANRGGNGQSGGGGDGIPAMAQLKLLRAMQAEVAERTREFHKKNPDAAKWTDVEKKELDGLQREQKTIADLIEEHTQKGEEGEKK